MVPLKSGISYLKVNEMQKDNINLSQKKTIYTARHYKHISYLGQKYEYDYMCSLRI